MSRSCWIITPGEAGFESQGRGLAEALHTVPVLKRVRVRRPWTWIPSAWWRDPFAVLAEDSDRLAAPWPDLVISCGRIAAPLAIAIKKASGGATRIVHVQDPLMPLDAFDLVIAPKHDGVAGPNVVATTGAIHGVTPAKLAAGAEAWRSRFAALPRPLIGVLIGGSNGRFSLDRAVMTGIADGLAALARQHNAGLAITPSRRTGRENERLLRERLASLPSFIWDGTGDNPYFGILALADVVVVTEDSVSMTSEALATGKPVYVARLKGRSRRQRRFHDELTAAGYTRPFNGELATWTYSPPDDTGRAAAECRRRFGWS
ncbi:MAG TPA: mitochondrial fission ELM1 family protein [Alphaproteobacteria bacterium]|nr:mitochondrial fission ELM1 family protein [Alphaproteobacteria bacterium]